MENGQPTPEWCQPERRAHACPVRRAQLRDAFHLQAARSVGSRAIPDEVPAPRFEVWVAAVDAAQAWLAKVKLPPDTLQKKVGKEVKRGFPKRAMARSGRPLWSGDRH